jgi:hypothetical protein
MSPSAVEAELHHKPECLATDVGAQWRAGSAVRSRFRRRLPLTSVWRVEASR